MNNEDELAGMPPAAPRVKVSIAGTETLTGLSERDLARLTDIESEVAFEVVCTVKLAGRERDAEGNVTISRSRINEIRLL